MIKKLYDWTMSLAGSKAATFWLALIAFVESSCFWCPPTSCVEFQQVLSQFSISY
ncbi:hypothetical protein EDF70_10676 [Neorhizobium sp. JUb45]|nr:hypothetical protein EDF70_10676 [Neorhizobium sp. JUb45]